ncbi:esterase/lipase family protein [Aurantiacibacter sp. MUD61]|uniref:esterase/lipase family protein n=1 Tax=Aurantiacibacter sp. MUD61 TaxID=3009083 RepID=UPI0022EFE90A|nr:alpha/beta fold hydrolase [Aurantiacibacter sp. MUD61]
MSAIKPLPAFAVNAPAGRAMKLSDALRHRLKLLRGVQPEDAHTPPLRYFFAELLSFGEPLVRPFHSAPDIKPSANPRVVILLPGFATGPNRMRYLARQLERAGHTVKRWGMGHNLGPTEETIDILADRVQAVEQRYGQKVVLIGWSLGGVFAREVAKQVPDSVAKVISMGSPFSHSPYSNNFWRPYQLVAGHSVEQPPIAADTRVKPPVETVAFWSPRDGVISRRAASGLPEERDKAVALRCSHLMFPNAKDCILALVRELEA